VAKNLHPCEKVFCKTTLGTEKKKKREDGCLARKRGLKKGNRDHGGKTVGASEVGGGGGNETKNSEKKKKKCV